MSSDITLTQPKVSKSFSCWEFTTMTCAVLFLSSSGLVEVSYWLLVQFFAIQSHDNITFANDYHTFCVYSNRNAKVRRDRRLSWLWIAKNWTMFEIAPLYGDDSSARLKVFSHAVPATCRRAFKSSSSFGAERHHVSRLNSLLSVFVPRHWIIIIQILTLKWSKRSPTMIHQHVYSFFLCSYLHNMNIGNISDWYIACFLLSVWRFRNCLQGEQKWRETNISCKQKKCSQLNPLWCHKRHWLLPGFLGSNLQPPCFPLVCTIWTHRRPNKA